MLAAQQLGCFSLLRLGYVIGAGRRGKLTVERNERGALKPAGDANRTDSFDVVGLLGELKQLPKSNSLTHDRIDPIVTAKDGSQSLILEPLDFGDSHRSTRGVPKHDKVHHSEHKEVNKEKYSEQGEGIDRERIERQAYKAYGYFKNDVMGLSNWLTQQQKSLSSAEYNELLKDLVKISHRPENIRQKYPEVEHKELTPPWPPGLWVTHVIDRNPRPSTLLPANVNIQLAPGVGDHGIMRFRTSD